MARTRFRKGTFRYGRSGGLIIDGDLEVTGELTAGVGVTVTEPFTFAENVTMEGNLAVVDVAASGDLTVGDDLTVTGTIAAVAGIQARAQAVTATADGLTTGLIPLDASFVAVTSGNSAHIITLPSGAAGGVGMVIRGWVGANGCEMRTPAASGATINAVDSDGTNQAAIPATTLFRAELVAADTWILTAEDELGEDIAAIVPDTP